MSTFDKFNHSFMEGKGLLIIVIIVFSSFSFVVGFFAGKKLSIKAANTNASTSCTPEMIESQARNKQQSPINMFPNVPSTRETEPPKDPKNSPEPVENLNKKTPKDLPPDVTEDNQDHQETPSPIKTPPPQQPDKTVKKSPVKDTSARPEAIRQPATVRSESDHEKRKPQQELQVVTHEPRVLNKQTNAAGRERYVIQVGAFKSLGEAMRLQEELKQNGFDSNISKHSIKEGITLYKVRLDYANSKDDAITTLSRLNKKGIKGFIKGETQ
ncbi:MAG: SPOR domain-containing protein [Nitrospirae bacterium]|nr:SPOR domain-containing protein [Nitrospirota bacterium]